MTTEPSGDHVQPRRARPLVQVGLGLLSAVVVLLLLVVPVVAMLLMAPRGTPTRLPDALALGLLAVAGVVAGLLLRSARTRLPRAATAAALLTLLALWFQSGTWWSAGFVPTPPLLPNIAATLTFSAGAFLAAGLLAVGGPGRRDRNAGGGGDGHRRAAPSASIVLGVVSALALVAVVEADVWGRGVIQATFQGPWGLGRFQWLAVLFFALLLAGMLVGWLAASTDTGSGGPAVATGIVGVIVIVIWIAAGELGGPPRSTVYGLGLGLLLAATAASLLGSSRRPG